MSEETKNQPVDRIRVGRVEASIWENEGKNGPWKSVTLSRAYEDQDGNLKSTSSFSGTDLLLAAEALRLAYGDTHTSRDYAPTRANPLVTVSGGGQPQRGSVSPPRFKKPLAVNAGFVGSSVKGCRVGGSSIRCPLA